MKINEAITRYYELLDRHKTLTEEEHKELKRVALITYKWQKGAHPLNNTGEGTFILLTYAAVILITYFFWDKF